MFQRLKKCSDQPYTMISNAIVKRPDMSRKAKGIMLYLLSLPDDRSINKEDIVNRWCDWDSSVRAGIQELEKLGYLFREIKRDKGRIVGYQRNVFEQPVFFEWEKVVEEVETEETVGAITGGGFPTGGKSAPTNTNITNTDINNIIYSPYGEYTEQAPGQDPPWKDILTEKITCQADLPLAPVTYGKKEINELIAGLEKCCTELRILYDKKDERMFAHHITTAKDFGLFAEKLRISRQELAEKIMIESKNLKFRRWYCSWPKAIYQNYVEVYNLRVKSKEKIPLSSQVVL